MGQIRVKAGSRRRLRGVNLEISLTFAGGVAEIFLCQYKFAPNGPNLRAKNRGKFAGRSEISWNIHKLKVAPIYLP